MEPTDNQNPVPQVPDPSQMPPIPSGSYADLAAGSIPGPSSSGAAPSASPADVPAMTLPLPPAPGQNPAQTPQNPAKNNVDDTTPLANPQVVDDGDLIEKEWVHKAKQIVDRNRNDPYKQSEELTAFRADYMKKRYNKNIKLDE